MDLEAYAKISELKKLAEDNGIDIPRLRGYRLMKDEEPVSQQQINKIKKECEISIAKGLCEASPLWNPHPLYYESSSFTDGIKDYYLMSNPDKNCFPSHIGIRWDRIHGKKRKILKFEIKKQKKKIQQQYDTWNLYAGKENVLYIHSRMGGNNWKFYPEKSRILNASWFLNRVDDCFDSTYCDFYAKIN